MDLLCRRLIAPLAALAASCAQAQLIDDVDLRRDGADAVVQVRFVTPVQYRRALVPRAGDASQVFYDLVAGPELPPNLARSERRLRGDGVFPDITVSDEASGRNVMQRRLVVRLSQAAPLHVRAGRGDRTIELVLAGLGPVVPAAAPQPPTAPPASGYQISLQQSDGPNLQLEMPIPASLQRYQVFTNQRSIGDRTVHEISLGYFEALAEAEAARAQLVARFPQATIVALAPPAAAAALPAPPAATPIPPEPAAAAPEAPAQDRAQTDARAAALLAAAKDAAATSDPTGALDPLNQLLGLPPNASTREAQALIGHVRVRLGDLMRARAEYETFLRLYPTGPDADRVREALAQLPAAPAPRTAARVRPKVEPTTTVTGSAAAFYYGGASKVRTQEFQDSPISGLPEQVSDNTLSGTDQRQVQVSVDLNWRYRDVDTDMRFVFRDAYSADQLNSDRSRNRLSALYVEHKSLARGTMVRLGRQSPLGGGVLGRFDGVLAGYTVVPKWRVNGVVGVPTDKLLDSRRHFYGASLDADAPLPGVSASLFGIRQTIDGEVDRDAVGTELRYFAGGLSANATADYDTRLRVLNIASLQGTWQSEDLKVVNLLFDRRKTPMAMVGNALFFQDPAQPLVWRIRDLIAAGTSLEALRERVRLTTSNTTQGLLGATIPVAPNWQVGADVRLTDVGEILPVADILPAGQGRSRNVALGAQLIATNLYSARDTHVIGASALRGSNYALGTQTLVDRFSGQLITYNNSSQLNEFWLLEPSLKFYRQQDSQGVTTTRWTPGLRVTWRFARQAAVESELSSEVSKSTGAMRSESSTRTYYYLGGRYDF